MTAMTRPAPQTIEQVLVDGDLSGLTPEQRATYYGRVCESLGLNPLTKPFAYIRLNNKLVLYALRDATDQLRARDKISVRIVTREVLDGIYVVTAQAETPDGRVDESTGAVPTEGLKGEAKANAMLKAETKAKRRVTLSICGLGLLDESEVDSIDGAQREEPRAKLVAPAMLPPDAEASAVEARDHEVAMRAAVEIADKKAAGAALNKAVSKAVDARREGRITKEQRDQLSHVFEECVAALGKK